ncbi:MAG: phage virion morphogenesis protein [Bacillota bacterium]
MVRIYVTAEGLEKLRDRLEKMAGRGKSLREPLGKAGEIMLHSTMENFEAEGRPAKWAPRSRLTRMILDYTFMERAAATKRYRRAKKWTTRAGILRSAVAMARGHKILQVSGDLKKSIHLQVLENEAVVGSAEIYARIHQFGGVIRPRRGRALFIPVRAGRYVVIKKAVIPARPYLLLQPDEKQKIVRIFEDWLAGE